MRGSIKITFSQFKSYCTHNFIKHDIPGDDKERCRVYGPKLQLCVSKNCPVWKLFKIRAKTYEEKITVARVRAVQQPQGEIAWLIDTISSANELMDEVNKVCLFEQAINDRIAKLRAMR